MSRVKWLVPAVSLLLTLQVQGSTAATVSDSLNGRKVLLVSMDGFRHDYFNRTLTPNFDHLIKSGVKVPYVNNTFVTSTFPSHTTIVTGLYEESHGIVGNKFYDPEYDETFSMRDKKDAMNPKWWNMSEPIWINAVKAGLKVGTFFWVGSEVPHDGFLPTAWRKYDGRVPFEERVFTVVDWLSRDNYDFAVVYFNEPDHTSHSYGPENKKVVSAIRRMDLVVGMLMNELTNAGIKDMVDIIITSDHGMTSIDLNTRLISITKYVNDTLLERVISTLGSSMHFIPQPNKTDELVAALNNISHVHAFRKEDIPDHFHYKHNRRIMPVFAYVDEGWMLYYDEGKNRRKPNLKGFHGFDNSLMSMKPIFVASGPSFKKDYVLPGPMESVDIYPLLCHLLNIKPAPNNGSLERAMPLLRHAPRTPTSNQSHLSTSSQGIVTTSTTPHDGAGTTYLPSLTLILCIIDFLLTKIII